MEKEQLRNVLKAAKSGDSLELNCVSVAGAASGTYKVLEVVTGRGKNGMCLVATLQNTESNNQMKLSTKDNKSICSIKLNGDFFGSLSEIENSSAPAAQNMDMHLKIKEMFSKTNPPKKVSIDSKNKEFVGVFEVVSHVKKAGRWGQVILSLKNPTTNKVFEVWSYKHSGLFTSFNESV